MARFYNRPVSRAAIAGLTYFGAVFAARFALGTLRVLVLTPRFGLAVAFKLPIMPALSWLACRRLIARFDVAAAHRR